MNFFLMCSFSVSLSLSAGAVRFCTGPAFAVAIMHSQLNFFVEIILQAFSDDLCLFVLLSREFPSPYARHPLFSSGIRLFVPSSIPLTTFGRPLFSSRFPLFSFSHSNSLRPHLFSLSLYYLLLSFFVRFPSHFVRNPRVRGLLRIVVFAAGPCLFRTGTALYRFLPVLSRTIVG